MKVLVCFTVGLLVGSVYTAPASNSTTTTTTDADSDSVTVTEEFFPNEMAIYTAEHEIVDIMLPLNALNFEEDSDDEDADPEAVIFFVLADFVDGKRVDKGLYIRKKGNVTKLLENGREATAANEDTKTAYFGAKEGLYSYNVKENKAEKYGTITDSIISLAKVNGSDIIYMLTEDHVLYKVTEEGTKKEVVDGVVNAQKVVLDYENNLYYYTSDKDVYVLTASGPKKFEGLPAKASYVAILRPPFVIEDGIPVVIDRNTYVVYANGTVEDGDFILQARPSAYAMEATLIHYYAYNKKIYEYNILTLLLGGLVEELQTFLEGKSDNIADLATRSRNDLRA